MERKFRYTLRFLGLVVALSFIVGVVLADFTIGSFTTAPSQSAGQLNPSPPAGVSFTSANAELATLTTPTSSSTQCTGTTLGSMGSPGALVSSGNFFVCLNAVVTTGYLATDTIYSIVITWTHGVAPANTAYQLSISLANSGGSVFGPTHAFVKTPSSFTGDSTAEITFDMSNASVTSITQVDVIVTQCSGATCP